MTVRKRPVPSDAINREGLPSGAPPKGRSAPKKPLTRKEIEEQMKKAGQKAYAKGGYAKRAAPAQRRPPLRGGAPMPNSKTPLPMTPDMAGGDDLTRVFKKGGSIDGCARKGKTKGKMV